MDREMMDVLEPKLYNIMTTSGKDELFASLQLGDNQHRRDFEIRASVRGSRMNFSLKLRIDLLTREDGSGNCWNFEGYAMPSGRWVRVEGFIRTSDDRSTGHLQVMARKRCLGGCSTTGEYRIRDRFCQNCGKALMIVEVPNLFTGETTPV
jgi:hypothetical protein